MSGTTLALSGTALALSRTTLTLSGTTLALCGTTLALSGTTLALSGTTLALSPKACSQWGSQYPYRRMVSEKTQARCSNQQLCVFPFRQAASCGISKAFLKWPCGLMDKALVFGTKDCRFESCQGHFLLPAPCAGTPVVCTHSNSFGTWREWANAFVRKLGVRACDTFCRRLRSALLANTWTSCLPLPSLWLRWRSLLAISAQGHITSNLAAIFRVMQKE